MTEELSPTGPKFHPENAQKTSLQEFFGRRTDIAEALLNFVAMPSLVLLKDVQEAVTSLRTGESYRQATERVRGIILARFLPEFGALQNKYGVKGPFLEEYLRRKIEADWLAKEIGEFEHDSDEERERKIRERYPTQEQPGGLADMMHTSSVLMRLQGDWARAQMALVEMMGELGNHVRRQT